MRKETMVSAVLLFLLVAIPVAAAVNNDPIAAAKVNPTEFYACECEGVELDGSGSYDLDGRIADADYEWTYNSQTFTGKKVVLGEKFTQNPGTYKFILKVTDNGGGCDETKISFIVKHNPRPQIDEMSWELETEYDYDSDRDDDDDSLVVGDKFTVEVFLYEKEYGEITYSWDYPEVFQKTNVRQIRDGQEATFKVISDRGWKTSHEMGVAVSNACGKGDTKDLDDSIIVKSSRSNQPPKPEITLPRIINEGESFQVSPAGSTTGQERNDSDDWIINCCWKLTDERGAGIKTSEREDPWFTLEDSGVYIISLKVTDRFGATGETSIPFEVEEYENDPPTADASFTKLVAVHGESHELNGSNSSDPDGDPEDVIGEYIWQDKTYGEELCRSKNPVCNVVFNRTGLHKIVLTVRDTGDKVEEGDDEIEILFDEHIIEITVIEPPETAPAITPAPRITPTPTPTPPELILPTPTPTALTPPEKQKSFLRGIWETIKTLLGLNP